MGIPPRATKKNPRTTVTLMHHLLLYPKKEKRQTETPCSVLLAPLRGRAPPPPRLCTSQTGQVRGPGANPNASPGTHHARQSDEKRPKKKKNASFRNRIGTRSRARSFSRMWSVASRLVLSRLVSSRPSRPWPCLSDQPERTWRAAPSVPSPSIRRAASFPSGRTQRVEGRRHRPVIFFICFLKNDCDLCFFLGRPSSLFALSVALFGPLARCALSAPARLLPPSATTELWADVDVASKLLGLENESNVPLVPPIH